jgi:nicotinamidase-related amidase
VPTTITTVETESFSGHTYPELLTVLPEHKILERTSMNSWDDQNVRNALAANGRKKVVVSGLWTEVCNMMFALSAMKEGNYQIYMVADASGATSVDAQKYAMDRMVQAGVVPMTWQQVLLEWQRDWARKETYNSTIGIVQAFRRLRHGRGLCLHAGPQGARARQARRAHRPQPCKG